MKATLTWEIWFDPGDDDPNSKDLTEKNIKSQLENLLDYAIANGLVTGDFDFDFGANIYDIKVEPSEGDPCQRCACDLGGDGLCSDSACPFSDYPQSDPRGWSGHPDHPQAGD